MVFIWKFGISSLGGLWSIYELLPAFLIALIVNIAVSLAAGLPEQDVIAVYDEVTEACKKRAGNVS